MKPWPEEDDGFYMKIMYFYQGRWPDQSPGVNFVTYNAQGFYRNNIDFELVTAANTREPVQTVLKNRFGIEEQLPIRLLRAGPFRRRHRVACLMGFFYLLCRQFDVLITRDLAFLPYALLLRRLKSCRVVFESHDFFSDLSLFPADFAVRRKKQSKQERRYSPKVDMIVCQTEHQKSLYEQHYPSQNVVTAVSGIRTYKKPSTRNRFQYRLGYIGTISSRNYDIELLIRALAKTTRVDVRLVLVGVRTEAEEKYVAGLAERFDVQDRIEMHPWLDPVTVDRVKETIDLGCCPLIRNKRNRVATPLKALDYFSAGIPVLYTDLQTDDFIVKDNYNGFLIEDSPEAWARAIDAVYADFSRYQELSENCLKTAEQYSWEQRAKRLHLFFRETFTV